MAMGVLISLIILIWTCRISLTWYRPTWRKNWFDSNSCESACPTAHVMGIHVSSFWWLTQRHWGSINYTECKMAYLCFSFVMSMFSLLIMTKEPVSAENRQDWNRNLSLVTLTT